MIAKSILNIALWNANGFHNHLIEVGHFLQNNNIDILLVTETRLTKKHNIRICGYSIYTANHPDGRGHGGAAVVIKSSIQHTDLKPIQEPFLQAASINLIKSNFNVCSVYNPPNCPVPLPTYCNFFKNHGQKFIIGGDFNAKHSLWGSRLINTKGKILYNAINNLHLTAVSTGHPTYWPSDPRKIPDLIDFFICKGIGKGTLSVRPSYDLSSDHSPIIGKWTNYGLGMVNKKTLTTDWKQFSNILEHEWSPWVNIRSADDLNFSIKNFTNILIDAAKRSSHFKESNNSHSSKIKTKLLVATKRRQRRLWQNYRSKENKRLLGKASRELRQHLSEDREEEFKRFTQKLTPNGKGNCSLWKAVQERNKPRDHIPPLRTSYGWAKENTEKAECFADHLETIFGPHNSIQDLPPVQTKLASQKHQFKWHKIKKLIRRTTVPGKATGFDGISGLMLLNLPDVQIRILTRIFNSIIRIGYYPTIWKKAKVIMVPKHGKDKTIAEAYRPISLLSVLSKTFERALLPKIQPFLDQITPNHQFGFRRRHGTVEQINRITNTIKSTLDKKEYCSAVFLDVSKAFDRVWHAGLKHKIEQQFPSKLCNLLCSYLDHRTFAVSLSGTKSSERPIFAGVPQGSVLGPALYILYTSDLPVSSDTVICTFADDTAILACGKNKDSASSILQSHLTQVADWSNRWKLELNETKSHHVTFSLRQGDTNPIMIDQKPVPQTNVVKYLGLHLDRRLTWERHILTKIKCAKIKQAELNWLLGTRSSLSVRNKILLFQAAVMPILTYGSELWATCSRSLFSKVESYYNGQIRKITGVPWYVRNTIVQRDFGVTPLLEIVKKRLENYRTRLVNHPSAAARPLADEAGFTRLKRRNALEPDLYV